MVQNHLPHDHGQTIEQELETYAQRRKLSNRS